jgi:Transcription factor WhiB
MVMILRSLAPFWEEEGAKCIDFAPTSEHDDWFGDGPDASEEEARKVCNGTDDGIICPAREQCLFFALLNNEHNGTWGGLTVDQRHYIRRNYPEDQWQWALAPRLRKDGELDLRKDGKPRRRVGSLTTQPPRKYPRFFSVKSTPTS